MHLNVKHIFKIVVLASMFFAGFEIKENLNPLPKIHSVHKDASLIQIPYTLLIQKHYGPSFIAYYFIYPCSYYYITYLASFSLLFLSLD